ncbi:MAG: site-2 protease family protein, partial [Chloroflexi bacterium]|nr:site-2 protease family protein [Chloroflexota bacterium]
MPEQIVYALIAGVIMVLVGFPIHEFMHAFTAYRLGDSTARW